MPPRLTSPPRPTPRISSLRRSECVPARRPCTRRRPRSPHSPAVLPPRQRHPGLRERQRSGAFALPAVPIVCLAWRARTHTHTHTHSLSLSLSISVFRRVCVVSTAASRGMCSACATWLVHSPHAHFSHVCHEPPVAPPGARFLPCRRAHEYCVQTRGHLSRLHTTTPHAPARFVWLSLREPAHCTSSQRRPGPLSPLRRQACTASTIRPSGRP